MSTHYIYFCGEIRKTVYLVDTNRLCWQIVVLPYASFVAVHFMNKICSCQVHLLNFLPDTE